MTASWVLARRTLELGEIPLVMGILNATPDSFSDGGRHLDVEAAVRRGREMAADGAAILDVGGESTRPGAAEVDEAEEIRRVVPVIKALVREVDLPVSIDTRKARVAEAALGAGAEIVNDVSGLTHDPRMATVVAGARAGVVLMHMRGTPETMQRDTRYDDLVGEVCDTLSRAVDRCRMHGIPDRAIVLDPGIGFGKRVEDNLRLLTVPGRLRDLGFPILLGASRKSMFGTLFGLDVDDRDQVTLGVTAVSAYLGASIVRVHEVGPAVHAVWAGAAMRNLGHRPASTASSAGVSS